MYYLCMKGHGFQALRRGQKGKEVIQERRFARFTSCRISEAWAGHVRREKGEKLIPHLQMCLQCITFFIAIMNWFLTGSYRHLVSRVRGCYSTSYNAQDKLHNNGLSNQKRQWPRTRNLATCTNLHLKSLFPWTEVVRGYLKIS